MNWVLDIQTCKYWSVFDRVFILRQLLCKDFLKDESFRSKVNQHKL